MNSLIACLILVALPIANVYGQDCSVCQLGGYFVSENGYRCLPSGNRVFCTCPDNTYILDAPCRICENILKCDIFHPNFDRCVETTDFGTYHACIFADANGNPVVTEYSFNSLTLTTKAPVTTTTNPSVSSPCVNGGVFYNGFCNCPAGYDQPFCGTLSSNRICDRINCTSNGYCIVRSLSGPHRASCTCKVPYFGEYCQSQGIVGSCTPGYCNNGGACKEFIGGTTKYAYCECAAGYNGIQCGNRYFTCPSSGLWPDLFSFAQGKYFNCTALSGGGFRIQQLSCPEGLRFNVNANLCTY